MATLDIPVSLDHLADVRQFVTVHADSAGLNEGQVDRLELAVVESVTNVIRHAIGMLPGASITLDVSRDTQAFWCTISYQGDEFKPPEPNDFDILPEDFPEGGFGIFLIYSACDSVTFAYVCGRNITCMEMRFENAI
ncbi:MAG: ATP-binding protein [Hydrogenophaga sp.]|uniref:ATP-binding protein n=1 Tax=Hydrogenophaga sp. TaxID=1904254 RepID=UPI0027553B5C|nr:ATP-binding protein [Hydrogenophaga sp.]MDP2416730.1 ATP-binding protein [Hydrogenophaga sp.]MDZ4189457.1 ATP-binding protein [Hydrogenophaga sp.]